MTAWPPRGTRVSSFDGTRLAAYSFGEGDTPPILLANAIGPDLSSWRLVIDALGPRTRSVAWDLRGLHGSEHPRSARIDAAAHCEDGVAVMDEAEAETFYLLAWSTGTHIAVEIARRYPERVRGLVVICGGFGRGFRGLFRYLELSSLFPIGAGVAKHFAPSLQGPFRAFVHRPEIAGVVRQSGLIGPSADIEAAVAILQSFADSDLRLLLAIYEEVVGEAGPEILSEVQAPTLLIAGARDRFTTPAMVDDMLHRIPDASKVVYEKGSHFLPIEYPQRVAAEVQAFL